MQLLAALRRLWRHAAFRRLLTLRLFSQAADGTLQVGMASYILFSPQSQPNAWAIAGVLALTLLPYSIIGPFVSPLLDRWSRRNIALYSDLTRAALAAVIGVIILTRSTAGGWSIVLYVALLIAMSINRFMLAGLSAGLQHTVEADEFLTASSIVPTVGPLGVVIGALVGVAARFGLGGVLSINQADAVVFALAALLFLGSVAVCRGFASEALGPGHDPSGAAAGGSAREVAAGLAEAARHLRERPVALVGLLVMATTRLLFGLLSVAVILAARHLWHPADQPELALADLAVWGVATGAGFILAAPLLPVLVRRLGLRRAALALLFVGAGVSVVLAATESKPVIFVLSFFIGLVVQGCKICVDTIVQAHVDEGFKGRAFTFYDMLFNVAFVAAAVLAAVVLPEDGLSAGAFLGMGAGYLACAAVLSVAARRLGPETFEKGTEDLTRVA